MLTFQIQLLISYVCPQSDIIITWVHWLSHSLLAYCKYSPYLQTFKEPGGPVQQIGGLSYRAAMLGNRFLGSLKGLQIWLCTSCPCSATCQSTKRPPIFLGKIFAQSQLWGMVFVSKFMRIDVLAEALLLCCCCCCVPYIAVLLVQLLLLLAAVATGVLVVGGQVAGSTGGPIQRAPRRTVPVEVRAHLVHTWHVSKHVLSK